MSQARVGEIDALKSFRSALIKFAEVANVAMGDAESDLSRMLSWLEHEQVQHWGGELRKRGEAMMKAKELLRMKQLFKSPSGARQSTVEEEKAVAKCKARLDEAEQKLANCRKYARLLDKAIHAYKGSMQRLGTSVQVDIPNAAAQLDRMFTTLEAYASLAPTVGGPDAAGSEAMGGMARASRAAIDLVDAAPSTAGPHPLEMRIGTPPAEQRRAAADGQMPATWAAGILDERQLDLLKTLNPQRAGVGAEDHICVGSGAETSPRIYLDRMQSLGPGDTGWYVGAATAVQPAEVRSITVTEFLSARPDLREVLALPENFLVVIGPAGITAIIDEQADDVWAAAPAPPAPAEPAATAGDGVTPIGA